MNKTLTAVSIACNGALVLGLLWMRTAHVQEVHRIADTAMRGDEIHLRVHEASLSALDSGDVEQVAAISKALRAILEAGELNIAARERAGFGH